MSKVPVYNQTGERVEELEVNSGVFGVKPDLALLEEAVRTQLANRRGSIAHTKTRDEVRGGGRKPWQQKGTGRARHGSIRSPLWSGGGVTFGPRSNRNWSLKMNKKAFRKALFMALTDKVQSNAFIVVDNFDAKEGKANAFSKNVSDVLGKANVSDRLVLLVTAGKNDNLQRAGRNLTNIKVVSAESLNIFDILKASAVMVLKDAMPIIEKTYLPAQTGLK
jgi:large subunit ribosomal protein L4